MAKSSMDTSALKSALLKALEEGSFVNGPVKVREVRRQHGTHLHIFITGDMSKLDCIAATAEAASVSGAQIIKPYSQMVRPNGEVVTSWTYRIRPQGGKASYGT